MRFQEANQTSKCTEIGGDTDVDVSFQYLKMFFEPDDAKLESIRVKYSSGDMQTGVLYKIWFQCLSDHQIQRRLLYLKNLSSLQLGRQSDTNLQYFLYLL